MARRLLVVVVLVGVVVAMVVLPAAEATAAPKDVSEIPASLRKYVPGSAQWEASAWMTARECRGKGGSFSRWAASVVADTPELLAVFHAKDRSSSARQDRERDQAIRDGYAAISDEVTRDIPAGVCVDDVKRWAGEQPEVVPFGFGWGMDPPWTPGSCIDFDPQTQSPRELRNKSVGAERAPCDGFAISCDAATGADEKLCGRWNSFSASYLQRVERLRRAAFNQYPPSGQADTDTRVKSPAEAAGDLANSWFLELTRSIAKGASTLLAEAMTFWTRTDRSEMLQGPAITEIRGLLWYVGLFLLVGSVMWQGIRMLYRRKPDPLISTGLGLLSFVGWSTLGGTTAVMLYEAGNALSSQVLDEAIDHFSDRMAAAMAANAPVSVAAVFFLALVLFFLAVIQWLFGFFRMGALVVVLALLPTAAAGQINESTKPWLRTVVSWALSLILYQPIAAVVFAVGFVLFGDGDDLGTVLTGIAVLALAVVSMPTMLRFFNWGGARFASGGGGGGGSMALGALASVAGGGGAVGFSRFMDHNGPGSGRGGDDHGALPVTPAHAGAGFGDGPGDGASGGDASGGGAGGAGGQDSTARGLGMVPDPTISFAAADQSPTADPPPPVAAPARPAPGSESAANAARPESANDGGSGS